MTATARTRSATWIATILTAVLFGSPGVAAPAAPAAAVVNPWVATDRSVDTSSIDAILKGLVKADMTDEQKVLACFNWIRRVIYHGDGPLALSYNFGTMVHSLGTGSCLRQTTPLWLLLSRIGYKCRTGATGGHHIIEIAYGGAWHLFDPHMNFYVYDRAKPPVIASIEQIKADPTLVTEAVKENRACPGFLLCGDEPSNFSTPSAYQIFGDFPESRKYTPVVEEPFCRMTLRRGETLVRTWMPGPYWFYPSSHKKDEGPRHGCGGRDAKDAVNLPLYEPHAAGKTYRHWGAGWLTCKPDLAGDHYLDAVVEQRGVRQTPAADGRAAALGTDKQDQPGEIVFAANVPYIVTAGELKLSRSGDVTATVSLDQGKTWMPVELKGTASAAEALFVKEVQGTVKGYWLKLTLAGGAAVSGVELKTHFQLVPFALPYLVPGRNTVSVRGDRFGAPLKVEWVYAEGPAWTENKTAGKTFDQPGTFEIDVAGEKYPRNVSLTLSVAP